MNIKVELMARNILYGLLLVLTVQGIEATKPTCPGNSNCFCGGTFTVEVDCNLNGQSVKIDILPGLYASIKCENTTKLNYSKLPYSNIGSVKTVTFKNCPLPSSSFKKVLKTLGVNKTMSLIFQNEKNVSQNINRGHLMELQDLTKLLLSVNGDLSLPENLFMDLNNLRWLNLRIKSGNISREIFKTLNKLNTLEISHNEMTNMPDNVFEHLTSLRKFSLWQSNITSFSKEFFKGGESLEELDLSSNNLIKLPTETFYPLINLNKLTLFSNNFSVIPENLFSQNKLLSTLIILNNNVKIKELPKSLLGNLPNLKQVHIQRCGIEKLSYDVFINSSRITNISLAYNEIKTLPESIFNDQINLLELDVSFNNLKKLGTKLFSSLVRLERLNLRCNSISEISGSIFSPLISLQYLNMERNELKIISSNLFVNNRQRITISFAFNELDFRNKMLVNNSWIVPKNSPFSETYNLKMLNLSHNKIKNMFVDWWLNGHEKIDLRFNRIRNLRGIADNELSHNHKALRSQAHTQIWFGNNNLSCGCHNLWFHDFVESQWKINMIDLDFKQCPMWSTRIMCYLAFYVIITITVVLFTITFIVTIFYLLFKQKINSFLKRLCLVFVRDTFYKNEENIIAVKYSIADEEFVLEEIIPGLHSVTNAKILMKPVSNVTNKGSFLKKIRTNENGKYVTIVIFSPNYLMTTYSQVNIKKIRGEMLKAKKTIYVFVDTGPDNSVFAFLKEQRDKQVSVLWEEMNLWGKIIKYMSRDTRNTKGDIESKKNHTHNSLIKDINKVKCQYTSKKSFMKLSDWPHTDALESFAHSQV
ncbi:protein toll-like [Battus philenor]|uniref:protein toll-like n=1 Tax=Battus philenor TaxID=42288 RepID=UPI0035CF2684